MSKLKGGLLGVLLIAFGNVFAIDCVVCGCNNEICTKAQESQFSTCMWKAEYECYNKYGICESNASGNCAWRQTDELVACLKLREQQVSAADAFSD